MRLHVFLVLAAFLNIGLANYENCILHTGAAITNETSFILYSPDIDKWLTYGNLPLSGNPKSLIFGSTPTKFTLKNIEPFPYSRNLGATVVTGVRGLISDPNGTIYDNSWSGNYLVAAPNGPWKFGIVALGALPHSVTLFKIFKTSPTTLYQLDYDDDVILPTTLNIGQSPHVYHLYTCPACSCKNGGTCGAPNTCVCNLNFTGPTCEKPTGYVGCFLDSSVRALPHLLSDIPTMTIEICRIRCGMRNYAFAGLQSSTQCFCGNTVNYGAATTCNMACSGNSLQTCGGTWTNSIYRSMPRTYMGCFTDTWNRDLPVNVAPYNDPNLTVEKCVASCNRLGYIYAGVQDGDGCFCGNSYGSYGTSSACNKPCTRDATETCGGFFSNSIYYSGTLGFYVGCFSDQSNRDLPFQWGAGVVNTATCNNACRANGYKYAGLQYGDQCFCGNSYGNYGPANTCSMPCSNDPGGICGNAWANSIYYTGL